MERKKSFPCIVREVILNRGVDRIFKRAYASFLLGHERKRLRIWKRNFQHSSLGTKEFQFLLPGGLIPLFIYYLFIYLFIKPIGK